jgi:hypothetical protein
MSRRRRTHPASAVLEDNGIVSDSDCLKVEALPAKRVHALYDAFYRSVRDFQEKQLSEQLQLQEQGVTPIDPFSFIASASLRSDAQCEEIPCRLKKLDALARYAALYANEVTVPLSLDDPAKVDVQIAKRLLRNSCLTMSRLRPLIDAEIVTPAVMKSFHCEHTIDWVNEMVDLAHAVAQGEAKALSGEFIVAYQLPEKSPTGRSTVYIDGPSDFMEHGGAVVIFDEGPTWRSKSWRFDKEGKTELKGNRKLFFVSRIFHQIANDTTFYLAYGRLRSARYLTDLRGEAFLLEGLTQDDELAASSKTMNTFLTHTVPLLGDLSIDTLIRIRSEERDSFEKYRGALGQALITLAQKKKRASQHEVREMFKEVIEPQLLGMRSELHEEQKRQQRRVVGGIGTLAATVALGMFGGIVPIFVKGTIAAAGAMVGGRLLSKAAEAKCEHGATLKEKNDFYFLLRLAQEAAAV